MPGLLLCPETPTAAQDGRRGTESRPRQQASYSPAGHKETPAQPVGRAGVVLCMVSPGGFLPLLRFLGFLQKFLLYLLEVLL